MDKITSPGPLSLRKTEAIEKDGSHVPQERVE